MTNSNSRNSRLWILGASDPEMEAIQSLLKECGERFVYAVVHNANTSERCHPGNAAHARAYVPNDLIEHGAGESVALDVYRVEWGPLALVTAGGLFYAEDGTDLSDIPSVYVRDHVIDHHHPGDPGFGRPASEFLQASSIGQVVSALARLEALPIAWRTSDAMDDTLPLPGTIQGDGRSCVVIQGLHGSRLEIMLPAGIVYTAAADHCLGAAYRGECPGVDPDALMRWRVTQRARHQGKPESAILADIERARTALSDADRILLCGPRVSGVCRGCAIKCESTVDDPSWDYCECPRVADMRETHVPELPEAGTRDGIAYIAQGLPGPDGRAKIVCSGTVEVIQAFFGWAAREGLVGAYGDPARGFAGAYLPEAE